MRFILFMIVCLFCSCASSTFEPKLQITPYESFVVVQNTDTDSYKEVELSINEDYKFTIGNLSAGEQVQVNYYDVAKPNGERFLLKKANEISVYAENKEGKFGKLTLERK